MSPCGATTKSGTPCQVAALPGRDRCYAHDPGLAAKRKEWRGRGGGNSRTTARAAKALPSDLKEVSDLLMEAFRKCAEGRLPAGRAGELSTLARGIVAVHEAGVGAVERADLAKEVEMLKEQVAATR